MSMDDGLAASSEQPESLPELSMEQIARILLQQRQELTLKLTIRELQQQLEKCPAQMNELLLNICKELNVDPTKVTFDLDATKLVSKVK